MIKVYTSDEGQKIIGVARVLEIYQPEHENKMLGHQTIYHYDNATCTHIENRNGSIALTTLAAVR